MRNAGLEEAQAGITHTETEGERHEETEGETERNGEPEALSGQGLPALRL